MKIVFDEKSKLGLKELLEGSSEEYLKIKVFYGCGRPAFDIYPSFKEDNDEVILEGDIKFIIAKDDIRGISKLEIKYDKEVYNKGFYIKDIG